MPLLRQSLYSQNVNIYLAPTADARDTWLPLMRTVACEGRCVVLSANQCVRKGNLPEWITGKEGVQEGEEGHSDLVTQGNEIPRPKLRRKSTAFTDDGHEIALPDLHSHDESAANGSTLRRKSTITIEGNEIVFPDVHSPEDEDTMKPRLRRKSVITEDGHEIVFPETAKSTETQGSPRREPAQRQSRTPISLDSEFACRGGSCIISAQGEVLAGPVWEEEDGLLVVDVDMDDCVRGRLDLDVAGSYSRSDAFKLTVEGLDLSPPP